MAGTENDTKRRIIDCAMALFREHGFAAVTINDICKESGVNKNTFYYYFDSKDTLFSDYYQFSVEYTMDELSYIMAEDAHVEQLWLMLKVKIEYFLKIEVEIMKQLIIINLNRDIGSFNVSDKHVSVFKMYVSLIKKAQDAGQIRNSSSPEILTLVMYQMMQSTVIGWCFSNGKINVERHMRHTFDTVLDVADEYRSTEKFSIADKWKM